MNHIKKKKVMLENIYIYIKSDCDSMEKNIYPRRRVIYLIYFFIKINFEKNQYT